MREQRNGHAAVYRNPYAIKEGPTLYIVSREEEVLRELRQGYYPTGCLECRDREQASPQNHDVQADVDNERKPGHARIILRWLHAFGNIETMTKVSRALYTSVCALAICFFSSPRIMLVYAQTASTDPMYYMARDITRVEAKESRDVEDINKHLEASDRREAEDRDTILTMRVGGLTIFATLGAIQYLPALAGLLGKYMKDKE